MISRRTLLQGGIASLAAAAVLTRDIDLTFAAAPRKTGGLTDVFFYAPHPDDETLSMSLAIMQFLAVGGYRVHVVSMNRGGVTPASLKLGVGGTACGFHGYVHNPAVEGFAPLVTNADVGAARITETRTAVGAMAMFPTLNSLNPSQLVHHDINLPDAYGGSDYLNPSPTGIALCAAVIADFATQFPNSLHYTMSPADHHPDHAAVGQALRDAKLAGIVNGNARFFISRLYWGTPVGNYAADLLTEAAGTLQWYGTGSGTFSAQYAAYCAWIRLHVVPAFKAWNPAAGAFGIGGLHSTPSQFANNFDPAVSMGNLWHG